MLDANTQTLLDKLKRADDTFSDSMNKIEKLSINLNKFLITNGSSAQSQESHFKDIINRLSELSQKSESLGNSITINDTSIQTLQSTVAELRNLSNNQVKYPLSSSDDLKSILAEDIDSLFTINPFNERVLKDVKHVTTNPTSHIDSYDENFSPSELRTLICEYLDSCHNFTDKTSRKILQFGRSYRYSRIYKSSAPSEIPAPFKAAIDLIHERFTVGKQNEINSVLINKYQVEQLHMPKHSDDEPSISPESQIFTLSLGDTCTVTFSDKCTSNERSLNVADNSIYSMSY